LILSLLIGLPVLGALLAGLFPQGRAAKNIALLASLTTFVFSLSLYTGFDPEDGGFQFKEWAPLVPGLGVHYSLGLDGLSLWFILLTTFLTPLVVLGSFSSVQKGARGFYACVLLLEAAMIGTLSSLDLVLFYLFWEFMLVPAFFLIGVWGGPERVKATVKFLLFTMAGSLLMLAAVLYLGHEAGTFDYAKLFDTLLPPDAQFWCFLAFGAAFFFKVPLFPFHAWLPDAYTQAPAAGTVMLSAVMVKLGVYGLLRFCVPLFPQAAKDFAPWIMVLAVAGVLHGALMASIQKDFKRMAAYSSFSHMGLVVLGTFTFSLTGLQGGILLMLGHGVYMAGLFLLMGFLYDRGGSQAMADYGGMAKTTPLLAAAFMWMMISAVGLPGFAGFPGEILVLVSAYKVWRLLAVLCVGGFVLSAWYWFGGYGKIFFGASANKGAGKARGLSWWEGLALLPLVLASLWIGLDTGFFLRPVEKTLQVKVIEKLKPPPEMLDFAVQQRRLQDRREMEERNGRP
jgi:NADH-quinone oxidoreductase subunit M